MRLLDPRVEPSSRSRILRLPFLLFAAFLGAGCGGGNGNAGQFQSAQSCGGTVPDAQVMANWTHRQDATWAYFMPDTNWVPVESSNGLDVSSPTGDAIVEFVFAFGPLVPTTVTGVEDLLWQTLSSHQVISQSAIVAGGPGQEQTVEFTGVWTTTGNNVHGIFIAGVGTQIIQGYLIQANVEVWAADQCTLTLIRNHITYLG